MRALKLLFVVCVCLVTTSNCVAQKSTPKAIEEDLMISYGRILYEDKQPDKLYDRVAALYRANEKFAKKLNYYTSNYPSTIRQKFASLVKGHLINIVDSDDGLFRIYSWDNRCTDFDILIQYKYKQETRSFLYGKDKLVIGDENYIYPFSKVFTLRAENKTFYLGVYDCEYSRQAFGTGVRIFDIENGKLNCDVKIIKTHRGLHCNIGYDFNVFSSTSIYGKHPIITFDNKQKNLYIPLLSENEKFTGKYIIYKFTGKYFEKVK